MKKTILLLAIFLYVNTAHSQGTVSKVRTLYADSIHSLSPLPAGVGGGSIWLLDTVRLKIALDTPYIAMPKIEGWVGTYYVPLSSEPFDTSKTKAKLIQNIAGAGITVSSGGVGKDTLRADTTFQAIASHSGFLWFGDWNAFNLGALRAVALVKDSTNWNTAYTISQKVVADTTSWNTKLSAVYIDTTQNTFAVRSGDTIQIPVPRMPFLDKANTFTQTNSFPRVNTDTISNSTASKAIVIPDSLYLTLSSTTNPVIYTKGYIEQHLTAGAKDMEIITTCTPTVIGGVFLNFLNPAVPVSSPSSLGANSQISNIDFGGYDSSVYYVSAYLQATTTEQWGAFNGKHGTKLTLSTYGNNNGGPNTYTFEQDGSFTVPTNITAGGTLNIGGGSTITEFVTASKVYDCGSIAAGVDSTFTITCTGAVAGNPVQLGLSVAAEAGLIFTAECTSNDVVRVRISNHFLVSSVNPASRTYKVICMNF